MHDGSGAQVLKGDTFDDVDAEERQLADVLLELRGVPRVVRVGLRAIAELMAADGIGGRGGEIEGRVEPEIAARPVQLAQEAAGTEERAAWVGAGNPDHRRRAVVLHGEAEALGPGFAGRDRAVPGGDLPFGSDCDGGPGGRPRSRN